MAMFEEVSSKLKYLSFIEEILPFTDIVPSATIGWAAEFLPQLVGGALQNGNGNSSEIMIVKDKDP
jgi:hypothetical protein